MKPRMIGLGGYARSGKDTVGQYLVERHGYTRLAFADAIRDVAYRLDPVVETDRYNEGFVRLSDLVDMHGWEAAKADADVRRLLQRLGTDAVRSVLGDGLWIHALDRQVVGVDRVVITDVRFPNEVEYVRLARGGQLWWVFRDGVSAINGHASEHAVGRTVFDLGIYNNGTLEQLYEQIDKRLGAAE